MADGVWSFFFDRIDVSIIKSWKTPVHQGPIAGADSNQQLPTHNQIEELTKIAPYSSKISSIDWASIAVHQATPLASTGIIQVGVFTLSQRIRKERLDSRVVKWPIIAFMSTLCRPKSYRIVRLRLYIERGEGWGCHSRRRPRTMKFSSATEKTPGKCKRRLFGPTLLIAQHCRRGPL